MVFKKKMKLSLIIKVNVMFLLFFSILHVITLLRPSASNYDEHAALLVRCSLPGNCHHKKENGIKKEKPSFMKGIIGKWTRIATVNMDDEDISHWSARVVPVSFDHVSETIKWKDLFPNWIDEEEENSKPSCPEIPMPDLNKHEERADVIVAKLPCRFPEGGWNRNRDVFRLQVHLVAARMAVERGRLDRNGRVTMVFLSRCMPMVEIFGCDEMAAKREGDWWYYRADTGRLGQKIGLPVGSCRLALPLWDKDPTATAYAEGWLDSCTKIMRFKVSGFKPIDTLSPTGDPCSFVDQIRCRHRGDDSSPRQQVADLVEPSRLTLP